MGNDLPLSVELWLFVTLPGGQGEASTRMLLAEDNHINQRVTQAMVARLGYRLDIVENGRAALAAVKSAAFEVVLMDVQMPEMDGLEATRRILDHFGDRARPYIIGLTAGEVREVCMTAGMDDYMRKPVFLADFLDLLPKAVNKARTWRRPGGH